MLNKPYGLRLLTADARAKFFLKAEVGMRCLILTGVQSWALPISADVAIIQKPAVAALAQQGKILAGTAVTLARSGVGVAVPAGRARPRITPGAARQRARPAASPVPRPGPNARHASGRPIHRGLGAP